MKEQKRDPLLLLGIRTNEQPGNQTVVQFKTWRICISNFTEDEQVTVMARHRETDESFILLEGRGVLMAADGQETYGSIHAVIMQKNTVYNIPQNIWHAHQMCTGSKLLIIENSDTNRQNSDRIRLSPQETKRLHNISLSAAEVTDDILISQKAGGELLHGYLSGH